MNGRAIMGLAAAFAILALLGLLAAIRLAPTDPALWHTAPAPVTSTSVLAETGGARLFIPGDGPALLARLDAIALATPRTIRLAGTPEQGRITWETRSLLWGFPDYTTAQADPTGVTLYARLRFGSSDMGVNAARLTDWLARLNP